MSLYECREVHTQVRFRVRWFRGRGRLDRASEDLLLLHRLWRRVLEEAPWSLSHTMIAAAMTLHAWGDTISLLHDGDLDPRVEEWLLVRAPVTQEDPPIAQMTLRHEYQVTVRWLEGIFDPDSRVFDQHPRVPPVLLEFFYKPNRTRSSVAAWFRGAIDEARRPPRERAPRVAPISDGMRRLRALLTLDSGELLFPWIVEDTSGLTNLLDRLQVCEETGRLLIALRRYERTHGRLPGDLDRLVAAVPALAEVPIDPYSGAPFRYDPARRLLWSVGPDAIDAAAQEWEAPGGPGDSPFSGVDWIWFVPELPPED